MAQYCSFAMSVPSLPYESINASFSELMYVTLDLYSLGITSKRKSF